MDINYFTILQFFNNGLIGVILGGTIGFLISLYFATRCRLSYQSLTYIEDDNLKYPLNTYIAIWNSGNKVIRASDITLREPLRIIAKKSQIIDQPQIKKCPNTANNLNLELIDEKVHINFDYLDPGDGFLFLITHGKGLISLEGKIIGGNCRFCGDIKFYDGRLGVRKVCSVLIVLVAFLFSLNISTGYLPLAFNSVNVYYSMLLVFVLIAIFGFCTANKQFPANLRIKLPIKKRIVSHKNIEKLEFR
ncbi:hypothetical protein [Paenibacillus sp. IHBB 10380]|uniref:hypothetical protein n=1 Tax=Paenibacillus sp. IHBB 10380 TaxID=1566358 RepID=UPI0005CF95C7|nr:hypothetical protein [Paenibacillus sp. IHBB 10380]AJS59010.1 hypothetical protein UB51_11625 [Paenibacillus sp. IHBB 10380]